MRPTLSLLSDGKTWANRQLFDAISDTFDLTDDEREELLPSKRQRRIDNKVHWALTHMAKAGLVERPERGRVRLTGLGREILEKYPERVDMVVLMAFPPYVEFRSNRSEKQVVASDSNAAADETTSAEEAASPGELLAAAKAENEADIEGELLARARALEPVQFERLVVRLLERMGYGAEGRVEHSGKPGDGGIDGIISQDPLGLDRIYVQAKRYDDGNSVQRPAIHQFIGALQDARETVVSS